MCPFVPKCELKTGFLKNFEDTCLAYHRDTCAGLVNVNGQVVHPLSRVFVSAEDVVNSNVSVSMCELPLRNPDTFVPGSIHNCLQEWEKLDIPFELRDWLKDGADVQTFIKPVKGIFKGKSGKLRQAPYDVYAKVCCL